MGELGMPVWGIATLAGLPLTLLIFIGIQALRGEFVTRKQLDAVQKIADTFQKAWEVSEQGKHEALALANQLTVTAQTMEKVLNALPLASTTHSYSEELR